MNIRGLLLCIIAFHALAAEPGSEVRSVNNISVNEIVARLEQSNRQRQQALQGYTSRRTYHLVYTGFPNRHEAEAVVEVTYEAPDNKSFTLISQSGSGWIVNHVFKKLLETEKEAADQKAQESTALNNDNYEFKLLCEEDINGRPSYVLKADPKTSSKLLYRGRIWVDAADFAVVKIEAEPAKRPSFWISKTVVHHTYAKIGDFWLPVQNESTSDVRLGGHATLSINYGNYRVASKAETAQAQSF